MVPSTERDDAAIWLLTFIHVIIITQGGIFL